MASMSLWKYVTRRGKRSDISCQRKYTMRCFTLPWPLRVHTPRKNCAVDIASQGALPFRRLEKPATNMTFEVEWLPSVEQDLAELWTNASDRAEITGYLALASLIRFVTTNSPPSPVTRRSLVWLRRLPGYRPSSRFSATSLDSLSAPRLYAHYGP